ncbi:unnamed protein product [Meloidogyne enterolobii]|uniref:Uncharacterized protein n=1 Tax=Meloidogyne enterolobii TaxID=390850 RepID=A0ACB1AIP8_MELEN
MGTYLGSHGLSGLFFRLEIRSQKFFQNSTDFLQLVTRYFPPQNCLLFAGLVIIKFLFGIHSNVFEHVWMYMKINFLLRTLPDGTFCLKTCVAE